MARYLVVGKGAVGTATAAHLAERGDEVLVISRTGAPGGGTGQSGAGRTHPGLPDHGRIEHLALDVADTAALAAASAGAAAIISCGSPPYHRWPTDWPPMSRAMLDAAERAGTVLVIAANLYGYGPPSAPMTERTPQAAREAKGRERARIWAEALARHRAGTVRVTEARASDYLGPGATEQSHAGSRLLRPLLAGGTVRPLGDPDAEHSWTYLPDFAATLAILADDERAWGSPWHVPSPEPLSVRRLAALLAAEAGVPAPRISPAPRPMLRAAGLFSPMLRELVAVDYQFTAPFVMDSSAATAAFGLHPTDWPTIAAQTVAWWRTAEPGGR